MDHIDEFRGSKNGGKELWVAGNGHKNQEQSDDHGGRCRSFTSPIRARPAAVGREIWPA